MIPCMTEEMGGPMIPCMGPGVGTSAILALASSLAMWSISSHGSKPSSLLDMDTTDVSIQYASTAVGPDVGEDGTVDARPVTSLGASEAMAKGGGKGTMLMTSACTCECPDPALPACLHVC